MPSERVFLVYACIHSLSASSTLWGDGVAGRVVIAAVLEKERRVPSLSLVSVTLLPSSGK